MRSRRREQQKLSWQDTMAELRPWQGDANARRSRRLKRTQELSREADKGQEDQKPRVGAAGE